MIVRKFNEFIEEGFLSKTLGRTKSGEKRLENKTPIDDYLKTIEWVDLGHPKYLFAKYDYGYSDRHRYSYLSLNEVEKIIGNLPKGISYLQKPVVDWIKEECNIFKENEIRISNNGEDVFLNYDPMWWYNGGGYLIDSTCDVIAGKGIRELRIETKSKKVSLYDRNNIVDEDKLNKQQYTLKILKEKDNTVSEGFLSKTLGRSKSGSLRLEDESFFKDKNMLSVDNNEGWFVYDVQKENRTYIYHYPNMKPVASFFDFVIFGNGTYKYDDLKLESCCTKEEEATINSDDFKSNIANYFIPF